MGRTSKFSFPLPGRKARTQPAQDGPLPASGPKLSKAERLLGTTGIDFHNQSQRPPFPHHELQPRPSYMTLSIAESNAGDDLSEHDTGLSISEAVPPLPPQFQTFNKDRYKPTHYYEPVDRGHPRSMSHGTVPLVRPFKQAPPVHTPYDHVAAPPLVEEQLSASAIKTRGFRKEPPIGWDQSLGTDHGWRHGRREETEASGEKNGQKRRPTKLDLSKLFAKPTITNINNPSTTALVRSPSTMSSPSSFLPPPRLPSSHSNMSNSSFKSPKILSKTGRLWRKPSSERVNAESDRQKKSARKASKGKQNWFDGLLEEEDKIKIDIEPVPKHVRGLTLDSEMENPQYYYPTPVETAIRAVEQDAVLAPSPDSPPPAPLDTRVNRTSLQGFYARSMQASFCSDGRSRSTIHSYVSQNPPESPRIPGSPLGSPGIASFVSEGPKRDSIHSSYSKQHPMSSRSGHSPLASPNTQNFPNLGSEAKGNNTQGFSNPALPISPMSMEFPPGNRGIPDVNLECASSASESEDDEDYSKLPRVRDSIALSEIDDVVMIGQAEAFQVKPRRIHESVELKRGGKHSVKSSVDTSQPLSGRTTPTSNSFPRPPSNYDFFNKRYTATVVDHSMTSPVTRTARSSARSSQFIQSKQMEPEKNQPAQAPQQQQVEPQHKLMAVTEEEEALLEMMRSKRAAMASQSFAEGYQTALGRTSQTPGVRVSKRESLGAKSIGGRSDKTARSRMSRTEFDPPLSPPPIKALPTPPISQQGSELQEAKPVPVVRPKHIKLTSTSTITSTTSVMTSFLDTADPSTAPSLTFDPADVNLSPLTPTTSPLGEIAVKVAGSSRASDSSEDHVDSLDHRVLKLDSRPRSSHSRQRTRSSPTLLSDDELNSENSCPTDDEAIPSQENNSTTSISTPKLHNASSADSLTGQGAMQPSEQDDHQPCATHTHVCGGHDEVRCSVSEDVLAAWGSLGGWRGIEHFRTCGASA